MDAHVVNLPPLFSFSKPGAHLYVEGVHKANWKPVRRLRVSLNHQTPGAGLKAERELQQALREHVQKPARKTR